MKTFLYFSFVVFLLIASPFHVSGQILLDSTSLVQVKTLDGNEYIGNIVSEDPEVLVLRTSNLGTLTILKSDIRSLTKIEPKSIVGGKLWPENTQSTRYFWAPNGYGLKAGEGYYQNLWVLFNQASFGITDYFSVGLGTVPIFFFGAKDLPLWVVPKFSIPVVKDKFNIGLGTIFLGVFGEGGGSAGILYGTGTLGNRDKNVTLGLGYGYLEGEFARRPMVNLSFMIRTGPKGYFLSENYYFPGDAVLLMLGGRSFARTIGIDYGLILPVNMGIEKMIAIPWLGITVPFGITGNQKTYNQ